MRRLKQVQVGDCLLGNGHIYIQSMLNVPADDIAGNVAQAKKLAEAGCEILRVSVPNQKAVALIPAIKNAVDIPLVADIHFDYRLALASVEAGVDKIRINPGNIGAKERVAQVANACKAHGVPIRIGVNGGSLEKDILEKHGGATPEALVESANRHIALLEECDFTEIVVSMKASSVATMAKAYRLMAKDCPYPLHLGVTEAGTQRMGLIKSAIGIGSLLLDGIGETIRVSLTADPVCEIAAAQDILHALDLQPNRPQIVSCPTCGRTKIDLISLANQVEDALRDCHKPIRVAVMGCVVNGPGEARDADIGIAGGDGCAVLFRHGEILRKVPENEVLSALLAEIEKLPTKEE